MSTIQGASASSLIPLDELAPPELADAVWLTAATQYAWGRTTVASLTREDESAPLNGDSSATAPEPSATPTEATQPQPEPGQPAAPRQAAPEPRMRDEGATSTASASGGAGVDAMPAGRQSGVGVRARRGAGMLDMMRALRAFKRRVPSPHEDEVTLDEEATAERAVQDGLWWPVTRPDAVRWLDLTVVIDTAPSMALWRSTVEGFVSALEKLGAFGAVQRRFLDTHREPVLRGATPDAPTRDFAELVDRSGRRIILVVTDGVGAAWRSETLSPMLARWGRSMPVAVAHLLPQRLWRRGGISSRRAKLTVPHAVASNDRWRVEFPDAWLDEPDTATSAGAVPVPIFRMKPRWLRHWAQLVTGGRRSPADAPVLLADARQQPSAADEDGMGFPAESAQQRVQRFLSSASPLSYRLATLLAAVPVRLSVARRIQTELVPESGSEHLAEVFTSGLLAPLDADSYPREWETAEFDFPQAVREELLHGARRSETARALHIAADHLGRDARGFHLIRDALAVPESTSASDYATIERTVMRALSGPYLARAKRLAGGYGSDSPSDRRATKLATSGGSSEMPGASDRIEAVSGISEGEPTSDAAKTEAGPAPSVEDDAGEGESSSRSLALRTPLASERRPGDSPPIWGNVPPRNPSFTGREELLGKLKEQLSAGGTTAILPAAIHGMSGIGKTQMAVEYIYRHIDDYDVVWWVEATQQAQVRVGLTELARQLRLPDSAAANTAVPAVREALRLGQPFRRWLLVFDSAENPEAIRQFLPTNGPGEVLVTSRNPDWAAIGRPLEVAIFDRGESMELLRRRGPEIDDAQANALADKLGDLPLAIAQAAAWRAETGMPVDEYLRLFDEKVGEILDSSAPNDYEVSLAAAWNVSFDELASRNPAAHQLLQVCAFFSPEPISRSLFTGVRGLSIAPELDAALRDPIRLSRAVRDINRYSLAKIDHRNDTLQLHRLVQLVLRDRMPPQRRAEMQHGAHQLLANLDPNDPQSSSQWPRYQAILPHAYAANAIECDDPWVRQLVLNLMTFLFRWGDHDEAARLARQAHERWTQRLGDADPQTLEAAQRLGTYLWQTGHYREAAELNQRTLELRLELFGENSEETINAQTRVLHDLRADGDFTAAHKLSEDILVKARGLFGDDDPVTLTAAFDHALSLRYSGQYREAAELDEDTYQRRLEVLGYDHTDSFRSLTALVLDRREAGDYAWARNEQEHLAERAIQLFGEERMHAALWRSYLAENRRKDGDHAGALELSGPALEHFRVRYGEDHPITMACALAHSIDLRHAGDLEEARRLNEQTFDRFRRNLGERHVFALVAAVDLAVTMRLLGDVAGAHQLDERSLEEFRAVLGPDHPYAVACAINLASDLAALGESKAALAVGQESRERAENVLGIDHPTTLVVIANLALDLRTLARDTEAEKEYADVLRRYRSVLGEQHPGTLQVARGMRANCDIDTLPL